MNFFSSITLQFKDAFSSGFTQAQTSFAGMKGALDDINKNKPMLDLARDVALTAQLTDPFRQKLSAMIDMPSQLAGTFDSSMRNIQSLTGETNGTLAETSKRILAIGGNSVAGPNAAADAFYNIASGVGRAEVRFDMLNAAMALSESGQADLGAATSGLISVVNAYNTPAENMGDLSDVFFQTVRKGVGSLDGFVSAMSSISGISASVGIGFDELGSSMAFITAKGQTESVAATQLKAAMVSLLRPNEELSKALASIGVSSGSAMLEQYGLAESLNMVKSAVGGSQDKMAKALGSVEALQAAIALTADDYSAFAGSYAGGLSGATAAALEAQAQSYEARVAKLQSAHDSLKIQIGDDVNAIKGFFVDIGAGFLTHVAAPLMSSPVGEVFQRITAGAALVTKGVLDAGSGALNTASQLVTLTATLQNAGGFSNLFGSSLNLMRDSAGLLLTPLKVAGMQLAAFSASVKSVGFVQTFQSGLQKTAVGFNAMGKSILGLLPKLGMWITSVWAAAAAHIVAFWPVYAIIGGIALLAAGAVLLVKHWDTVKTFFVGLWNKVTSVFSAAFNGIRNLLAGVSNKVLAVIAVFMPFIGIPALIIKNWDAIKAFFIGLWVQITELAHAAWTGLVIFFSSVWDAITTKFTVVWTYISQFFSFIWDSMTGVVASIANWFSGVWGVITGGFAAAWLWVSGLFVSVWEGIKGVIMGFVEWLQPIIDIIIAPFKAIGNVIGGIINTIGGWFGDTVDKGNAKLAETAANKMKTATAGPAASSTTTSTAVASTPTAAMGAAGNPVIPPVIAGNAAITPPVTGASGMIAPEPLTAGSAIAAPAVAGNASAPITTTQVNAAPVVISNINGMDSPAINRAASSAWGAAELDTASFADAMPRASESIIAARTETTPQKQNVKAPSITIQNLSVNAADIQNALDFLNILINAANAPEEAFI